MGIRLVYPEVESLNDYYALFTTKYVITLEDDGTLKISVYVLPKYDHYYFDDYHSGTVSVSMAFAYTSSYIKIYLNGIPLTGNPNILHPVLYNRISNNSYVDGGSPRIPDSSSSFIGYDYHEELVQITGIYRCFNTEDGHNIYIEAFKLADVIERTGFYFDRISDGPFIIRFSLGKVGFHIDDDGCYAVAHDAFRQYEYGRVDIDDNIMVYINGNIQTNEDGSRSITLDSYSVQTTEDVIVEVPQAVRGQIPITEQPQNVCYLNTTNNKKYVYLLLGIAIGYLGYKIYKKYS